MFHKLIKRVLKRIKQILKKFYMVKIRKYVRLSSYPYVSGDTFRKHSDFIYDEISFPKFENINSGDTLFVKTDYLNQFVDEHLDEIKEGITIIFHNSDQSFLEKHIENFTKKNITVFSQNLDIDIQNTKNIHPLPIGIENRSYLMHGRLKNFEKYMINNSNFKTEMILSAFNPNTNPERLEILKLVGQQKNINFLRFSSHKEYLKNVSLHKFNICPEGNGIDTHRFWESLMMNTIPFVKKNNLVLNFKKLGVPCYIVDEWSELTELNLESLDSFYNENLKILEKKEYIYFDYWSNFIKKNKKFNLD